MPGGAGGFPVWDEEKKERIRQMAADGKTVGEIGAVFDRDGKTIANLCRRHGIERAKYLPNQMWPGERVIQLTQLWAEGKSAGVIAQILGLTRNAIVGKVHRLNLPTRKTGIKARKPIVRRERGYSRSGNKTERRQVNQFGARGPRVFDFVQVGCDLLPTHADKPSSLFENNGCRWPCDGEGVNTVFCGGERFDKHSYCLRHCQLAYQPPNARRRSGHLVP